MKYVDTMKTLERTSIN